MNKTDKASWLINLVALALALIAFGMSVPDLIRAIAN